MHCANASLTCEADSSSNVSCKVARVNFGQTLQLDAALPSHASKETNTCAMARTHLELASSPQLRRAADSLYYRQYAFLKLCFHEAQRIADIKDTLSNSESVLERQGLQQFPERIVRHFKPGEHQGFLSVSQNPAWLEVRRCLHCTGKKNHHLACIQILLATGCRSAGVCFCAHT